MSENIRDVQQQVQLGITALGEAPVHVLIHHLESMSMAGLITEAEELTTKVNSIVEPVMEFSHMAVLIKGKTGEGADHLMSALEGSSDAMGEFAAIKAGHAHQHADEIISTASVLERRRDSLLGRLAGIVTELTVLEEGRLHALAIAHEGRDRRDDAVSNAELYLRSIGGTPERPTA